MNFLAVFTVELFISVFFAFFWKKKMVDSGELSAGEGTPLDDFSQYYNLGITVTIMIFVFHGKLWVEVHLHLSHIGR